MGHSEDSRRVWDTSSERERKAAYRARKRSEAAASELVDEQAVRDRFGYSSSERRSKAERDATAERIRLKMGGSARLSLVQFPVQREGDLRPSAEALRRLGGR